MAPLQLEALLLGKVGHSLITCLGILIAEIEASRILVALAIVAGSRESPRTLGVDFAQEFQVPFVVDGKIISTISQIESSVALIAISRHDKTAAIALGKGEETIRNGERHRYITHHEVSRTKDYILARTHLGTRERDIEIRMWVIAGGVTSMLQIDHSRRVALGAHTRQETVLLLGIYIINKGFLALEVELDGIGIILVATHLEYRLSLYTTFGSRVGRTHSLHVTLIDVHRNTVAGKIHILILHLRRAIKMRHLVLGVIDKRVGSRISDRSIYSTRLLAGNTVETNTVVHHLVVLPDSLLQRVHAGSISHHIAC